MIRVSHMSDNVSFFAKERNVYSMTGCNCSRFIDVINRNSHYHNRTLQKFSCREVMTFSGCEGVKVILGEARTVSQLRLGVNFTKKLTHSHLVFIKCSQQCSVHCVASCTKVYCFGNNGVCVTATQKLRAQISQLRMFDVGKYAAITISTVNKYQQQLLLRKVFVSASSDMKVSTGRAK